MKLQTTHYQGSPCSPCSLWLIMLESGSSKTRRTVEKSTPCLAKLAASLARSNSNCMRLMCAAWIHMSSPPFVHYHSGAPTSSLASLGCLGAEEDLGVPEKGGSELAKRVPSSGVDRPQCLHVVQL